MPAKSGEGITALLNDIPISACNLIPSPTVTKQTPVAEIARILATKNAKQVIVLEQNKPAGIVTLTDVVYKAVAPNKPLATTTAWDICTRELFYLHDTEPLSKAYMYMIANNHLVCPIMAGGIFTGLLTFGAIAAKMREYGNKRAR